MQILSDRMLRFRLSRSNLWAVALGIYLLPSIIAVFGRPTRWAYLFPLNLLTGWTVIGWGVALSWSLR